MIIYMSKELIAAADGPSAPAAPTTTTTTTTTTSTTDELGRTPTLWFSSAQMRASDDGHC